MMTQSEIMIEGYRALVDKLGVVGMIRFIQYYDRGSGDYTQERHLWLDAINPEDLFQQMERIQGADDLSRYDEIVK